ncbi:ribonuclease H [Trifolium pratense]|uniref:Ribonuclease H n=1 Tax=Trifolium pratense TaxID=57577 RepID=A0A2K3L721_TRIPR|nr:ribonuclease H [Trifolium pratense]
MFDNIITPFQSSFLLGRGTCDNAIIRHEIIHSMRKSKAPRTNVFILLVGTLLPKSGRVMLAKSLLNSIPAYYMQISWLPSSICSQIDQMTRNFIWKGPSNKGILVGWSPITKAKTDGGLGVLLAREANTSMLGKLVWDIPQNSSKLWRFSCFK